MPAQSKGAAGQLQKPPASKVCNQLQQQWLSPECAAGKMDTPFPNKASNQLQLQLQGGYQLPTQAQGEADSAEGALVSDRGDSDSELEMMLEWLKSGTECEQQQHQVEVPRPQQGVALSGPKQQQQQQRVWGLCGARENLIMARMVGLENPTGTYHCAGNSLLQTILAVPGLRAIWLRGGAGSAGKLLVDVVKMQLRQLVAAQQQSRLRPKAKGKEEEEARTEAPLSSTELRSTLAIVNQQCPNGSPLCAVEVMEVMLEHLDEVVLIEEAEQRRRATAHHSSSTSSSSMSNSSYVCYVAQASCSPPYKSILLQDSFSVALFAKCHNCGKCRVNCCRRSLYIQRRQLEELAVQQAWQPATDVGFELFKYGVQLRTNCCARPSTARDDCELSMVPEVLVMVLGFPEDEFQEEDENQEEDERQEENEDQDDFNFISVVPETVTLPGTPGAQAPKYVLHGLVLYYDQHFTAAVLRQVAGKSELSWVTADDSLVTDVGSWPAVVEKCLAGRSQPRLLFYQRVA
jgi:hypothetical protein